MDILIIRRVFAACIAMLAAAAALAQTQCVVRDSELQGRYEGPCVNGLAQGEGFARGTGVEYRGGFRAGMKHGQGVKSWDINGDRFEGEFVNDLKHGRGTYSWGPRSPWTGERFEGEYRYDVRQGVGTYTWSTGDQYTGPWESDMQKGPATPRQQQRLRAQKAAIEAFGKPGARACSTVSRGIADRQSIEGEIVMVLQDRVLIQVKKMDGRVVSEDIAYWDIIMKWQPCPPA